MTPVQPEVPDEAGLVFPFIPGLTPNFIQHFDVKMLRGQPPFSGVPATRAVLEVSLREDARASEEHVIAIADFVPPLALTHLSAPAPGSTLTWMLEMIAHDVDLPVRGWRVDVELASARDGYTSQSVMIWGPGGVPVALSRQSMLVFG